MPLAYAVLVGVAPLVLGFFAGFFRIETGLSNGAYLAWFILSLTVGAVVMIVRRRR